MARSRKTTPAKPSTDSSEKLDSGTKQSAGKGKLSTAEARREYQRRYYQRQYNLTHKKKARGGRGRSNFTAPREVVRTTFNTADIMHAPVEKTVRILEKIIKGERFFTM